MAWFSSSLPCPAHHKDLFKVPPHLSHPWQDWRPLLSIWIKGNPLLATKLFLYHKTGRQTAPIWSNPRHWHRHRPGKTRHQLSPWRLWAPWWWGWADGNASIWADGQAGGNTPQSQLRTGRNGLGVERIVRCLIWGGGRKEIGDGEWAPDGFLAAVGNSAHC